MSFDYEGQGYYEASQVPSRMPSGTVKHQDKRDERLLARSRAHPSGTVEQPREVPPAGAVALQELGRPVTWNEWQKYLGYSSR